MKSDDRTKIFEAIPGGKELLDWFGRVPSFHDAEVLGLHVVRSASTILKVHTGNTTDRIGADGYFVLEKHTVVSFALDGVVDLRLEGFNEQNVIGGLSLTSVPFKPGPSMQTSFRAAEVFELVMEPLHGMSGFIQSQEVSVSYRPGKP